MASVRVPRWFFEGDGGDGSEKRARRRRRRASDGLRRFRFETRRARPAPGRAPGGGGGGGGGGGDGGGGAGGGPIARLARAESPSRTFSNAQPRRGRDWVNPAGVRATFAVNTCGVPPAVRARQAPWPACRVLLVGCPGGRSAPDADPAKPACAEWDVSRALEMVPESDFEKHGLGSFSVTTSMYGPGDEFAFAMVKPGCTDAQIARALRAQGGGAERRLGGERRFGKRRVRGSFGLGVSTWGTSC